MVCSLDEEFFGLSQRPAPQVGRSNRCIALAAISGCAAGFYRSSLDPERARDQRRHCERSEAIQSPRRGLWIASSASPPRNAEAKNKPCI
jgi:hypothetical protein